MAGKARGRLELGCEAGIRLSNAYHGVAMICIRRSLPTPNGMVVTTIRSEMALIRSRSASPFSACGAFW